MEGDPMNVLLVDDDSVTRSIIARLLAQRGHAAAEFGDAETAWEACRQEVFSLCVLDWELPGMSGLDLCRKIRTLPYGESCAVLIITGRNSKDDLHAILDAGAHDYLSKPLKLDSLDTRLAIVERLALAMADRKAALEALRRTKALAEQAAADKGRLIASVNAFFICLDEHNLITEWTITAETLLGPSVLEVLGQPLGSLTLGWDQGMVADAVDRCRRLGRGVCLERVRFKAPAGADMLLKITVSLAYADNAVAIIIMGEDVTERQRLEQQLRQADKMASIGQLAAGVAHEINNPIGFVKSNLNSLEEYVQGLNELLTAHETLAAMVQAGAGPDALGAQLTAVAGVRESVGYAAIATDLRPLLEETKEGIERVRGIVQNLKEFSHVESAEAKYADVNRCLQSTLKIVWNELKYKAEVAEDYGPVPEVRCFAQEINQVFVNLLVNAGQAITDRGAIRIRTFEQDGQVAVEIGDTGCGIQPEHLSRIFEPFYTTKEVGTGTGLGLSISYGIIQKHHGRIEVESTVGQGTTFRVWLPVEQVAGVDAEQPQPAAAG
jgi:PAS domain S-box-containing protein